MASDFNETDYRYFKKGFEDLKTSVERGMSDIQGQLKVLNESYVKRDEFKERLGQEAEARKTLRDDIDKKLDITDFEPFRKTMSNLNWLVLTAVLGALLALVVKST